LKYEARRVASLFLFISPDNLFHPTLPFFSGTDVAEWEGIRVMSSRGGKVYILLPLFFPEVLSFFPFFFSFSLLRFQIKAV